MALCIENVLIGHKSVSTCRELYAVNDQNLGKNTLGDLCTSLGFPDIFVIKQKTDLTLYIRRGI
jgi:hypothetical protein